MSDDRLVEEQAAYYRARAGEYDEWWQRRGRYDRGPEHNARWHDELRTVQEALHAFAPRGDVLELACGTGQWTRRLVRHAETLTAVDASAETIAINRAIPGHERVRFVQADLFSFAPPARYDVVFFGFWLSHVPPQRFDDFWDTVASALRPGGRFFLVDSTPDPSSTAVDHAEPDANATTTVRRLNDGRTFEIVKVFYEPQPLSARLRALGWDAGLRRTPHHFLYGGGRRSGTPDA